MRIELVGDLGPDVGLGHRRRLEAIATVLVHGSVSATVGDVEAVPPGADVLVVDSYRHRADDRTRFGAPVVVAIDELERDLAVDLAVDPTPGGGPRGDASAGRVLAGADYALVDPELEAAPTPIRDTVDTVLVTFGASRMVAGVGEVAERIVAAHPSVAVTVAVGPWAQTPIPPGVRALRSADGLRVELARADIVVTAGGVTVLEACAAGRPSVVVCLADNQRRAIDGLVAAAAVVASPLDAVPDAVDRLVGDATSRCELAARARATIDGTGARRVADAILELAGR